LVVHLGYRAFVMGSKLAAVAMWALSALIGGWIVATVGDSPQAGLLSLHPPGIWGEMLPGAYVLIFATALLATVVFVRDTRPLPGPAAEDLEHLEGVDAGHH
jgi:alpha-1,2-mannosyltransferase